MAVSYTHLDVYKRQSPRWVAPVLERMPEINTIIDSPFVHGQLSLKARRDLASRLRKAGYQRAYIPVSYTHLAHQIFSLVPLKTWGCRSVG